MGERSHGAVEIGIGDGDSLHSVPRPALLHFDDLSVPRELIGDLAHSRHTRVGELDRKVAVTVRHNPNVGCRRKTWVLRMNRLKDEILTPYNLGTNIHTFVISALSSRHFMQSSTVSKLTITVASTFPGCPLTRHTWGEGVALFNLIHRGTYLSDQSKFEAYLSFREILRLADESKGE